MEQQDLIKKLNSKTWQFTYDRRMSYQRMKLFDYGYCQQLSDFFNVDINSEIFRVKDGNVFVYYEPRDHKKAFLSIQDRILNEKPIELIRKIHKTIIDYYAEFIKAIENKPLDYSSYTNTDLVLALKDFYALNSKISLPTWLLYLYFEEVLTHALKNLLTEKLQNTKKVEEIISTLSQPSKITPLDAYSRDLYTVILYPQVDHQKNIEKFAQKYSSWGVYDVNYEVPGIDFHKNKLKDINSDTAKELRAEIDKKYEQQAELVKNIKEQLANDAFIFELIDLYSFYADFKDWKNYYREQSSYKLKILFQEIARKLSLAPEQVSFLTEKETEDALSGKDPVVPGVLDQRIKNSAFVFLKGELSIVTELADLAKIDDMLAVKEISTIKGVVAYPGIVTGTAKIIFTTKDFDKVNEGDILVSSTTRPDYLPFMKKAGGFITNEGGMLSHAAILARELKKPCIIGTKNATQVLKDGDLIEVDAKKGIIKVIK